MRRLVKNAIMMIPVVSNSIFWRCSKIYRICVGVIYLGHAKSCKFSNNVQKLNLKHGVFGLDISEDFEIDEIHSTNVYSTKSSVSTILAMTWK